MSIYLDASFLVPTLVEEPASGAVRAYLATRPDRLISDFAAAEVASALSRLVRTGLLTAELGAARLADFEAWRAATSSPVELHPADVRLAYAYVRRFELMLRAPDALHLAIALRIGATVATLDRRLVRAAEELGVSVEAPA
jgi:uncharacterized protein